MLTVKSDQHESSRNIINEDSPSPQQRKKRRSATERRASHRRRSSQNEIEVAQIRHGLNQKRGSTQLREGIGSQGKENSAAFPILAQSEPPEPDADAPGEDIDNEENLDIGDPYNSDMNSPNMSASIPLHQRSLSDQMINGSQLVRRNQQEFSPDSDQERRFPSSLFEDSIGRNKKLSDLKRFDSKEASFFDNIEGEQTAEKSKFPNYFEGGICSIEKAFDNSSATSSSKLTDTDCDKNSPIFEHSLAQSSTSTGFIQLVGRFSAHRQHSDSNLLKRTEKNELGRRSFKWKYLLGRKDSILDEFGRIDSQQQQTGGRVGKLGPLPEDVETELGQKKRHSALLGSASAEEASQKQQQLFPVVRMRNSSLEGSFPRPFSIIGTRDELEKYKIQEDQWKLLQHFLREQRAKEEVLVDGWEEDSFDDDSCSRGAKPPPPPRMSRTSMRTDSPKPFQSTLGRPNKQKLQRTISNKASMNYAALTLPRKKGQMKVAMQQRKRLPLAQNGRRKSIVHLVSEQSHGELAAALLIEQQQMQKGQKSKRTTISRSSLKQLLGGSERNLAKVAPKLASMSTGNRSTAEVDLDRSEKDKKREVKANSMILGTIWSIRQRRKKETAQRNLSNLWALQGDESIIRKLSPPSRMPPAPLNTPNLSKSLLQSPLSPGLFSSSHFKSTSEECPDSSTVPVFPTPLLVQPQWEDLELWAEQAMNWASKFVEESASLGEKERKRQNVIYELVLTERHHCQVLIILKQLYREGILSNRLVPPDQLKQLIPDVLEPLLDFHLTLLRRLQERCSQSAIVGDIADILLDHFQSEQFRSAAINGYTAFCLGREESTRYYSLLMAQNQQFRKFMEFHEGEHKDRSFKDCLLLIAQRLTKYPVLVEQMAKLECQVEQRELAKKGHAAVRQFAMEVDQKLLQHELGRQWERVKKVLDKTGMAKIIHPKEGQEFSMEDLVWPMDNGTRKLLLMAKVFWRETMNGPELELRLLLCDDLIVFLRPKTSSNGSAKLPPLQFFRHSEHAGVFPLQSILVRENPRRKSLLLIQTAKQRPDLFELAFSTCTELEHCARELKKAKANASSLIHLANGRVLALDEGPIREGQLDMRGREEAEFQAKMTLWMGELDKLFEDWALEEGLLEKYFRGRMQFMDRLREQLERMPMPGKEGEREREAVKRGLEEEAAKRFARLERSRAVGLARLVERAQRAREADLPSIFDELHDLGADGENTTNCNESSAEEPRTSDEERRKAPRRVSTYHGAMDQKKKTNTDGTSSGGGIRRHTTVPGRAQPTCSLDVEEEEERAREARARLPLKMGPAQRKATAEIINENLLLRVELNKLRLKCEHQGIQLKALQRRGQGQVAGDLAVRETELGRREDELKAREAELVPPNALPAEQNGAKEAEEEDLEEEEPSPAPGREQSSAAAASKPGPSKPVRISNTYCGAGPVPSGNGSGSSSRSVENSPDHLAAERRTISQTELPRHLAVKTETKPKRK